MKMARPSKGISEFKLYDEHIFTEEYGFPPRAMADYLALMGDSVDNIPGVPGIGDKTARALLAEYGSLDAVYNALDSIPASRRAKLADGRESAYMSYGLVIPQPVSPVAVEALRARAADGPRAAALCAALGLKSLASRLGVGETAAPFADVQIQPGDSAGANHRDAAAETNLASLVSEHVLSISDDPPALAARSGQWAALALNERSLEIFKNWLGEDGNYLVLADYRGWSRLWPFLADYPEKIRDVELAHYFFHPDAKAKEHGVASILGGGGQNIMSGAPAAAAMLPLWDDFVNDENGDDMLRVMSGIDAPLTSVLEELHQAGIGADGEVLKRLDDELRDHIMRVERDIYEAAGEVINLNSPKQLGELLFERLRLPAVKKTKTGYSTDVSVLEELARLPEPMNEIPLRMLDYRECSKMRSGFVQPFIKHWEESGDGRIHSTFLHDVTGTARLASRDPNVQNIPVFGEWAAKFRSAIIPGGPSRIFVAADYSQIELRVLAHLSGDEKLLEAFRNDRDVHLETASWVFGLPPERITPEQRRFAKTVNFGLLYGMEAHGLAERMGVERYQAAELVERYFSVLPRVRAFREEVTSEAKARGYTRSMFGRIRPLSEVTTVEGRGGRAIDRVAVNTPIQSAAADIAKIAMIRFNKILRESCPDSRLVLQVHDSLICETDESRADEIEALLVGTMEGAARLDVPLKADPKRGRSLAEL
jgi:DNA polymerase-1